MTDDYSEVALDGLLGSASRLRAQQPVIKERQYQGTIDPLAHWLAEIKQHNNDDSITAEQRKAMINYVLARLEQWKKQQGRG